MIRCHLLDGLLPVYEDILKRLSALGAEWIQIDEPVFALDLTARQLEAIKKTYERLSKASGAQLMVASYFGELRSNLQTFVQLPVAALHIDAVRGAGEVAEIARSIGSRKLLSVGVIDGRNIWKNDFTASLEILNQAKVYYWRRAFDCFTLMLADPHSVEFGLRAQIRC